MENGNLHGMDEGAVWQYDYLVSLLYVTENIIIIIRVID